MDRDFCLHFGAAVETLRLSVDVQEGGALGLDPGAFEFLQFLVPTMVQLSISALCATFYQGLILEKEFLEFYCLRESLVAQIVL